MHKKFAICITTKNRQAELAYTLEKIAALLQRNDVECIICDDGSNDGTSEYIATNFPKIKLLRNSISKGLISSRNKILREVTAEYAVSIDDDLHFITNNPLDIIEKYFNDNADCAVISFRIFWSRSAPASTMTAETPHRMKSFAGGAHAMRMTAWKAIPDYPAWFVFYGEEDFAAYQLFKKNLHIHYLPDILVHHRVNMRIRKKDPDYIIRQRRSMRSGWYLFFLFLPWKLIPGKMLYSIWIHLTKKVFKGDFRILKALLLALCDLISSIPKIIAHSNRLTNSEYKKYLELPGTKLYWKPSGEIIEDYTTATK